MGDFGWPSGVRHDEIGFLDIRQVLLKHEHALRGLIATQTPVLLEQMTQELPDSQSVDARGRQLDPDLLFEMLDTIQLEFDSQGNMEPLNVVGGLFSNDALQSVLQEIENDPELTEKFEELARRKREAWRARETDRKLVG